MIGDRRGFWRLPLAVGALVLLARLPFLWAGYGYDLDAWRLVEASRKIAATSRYVASRLPGHPLQEYACAVLEMAGPGAVNGAAALLSAAGAAAFALP